MVKGLTSLIGYSEEASSSRRQSKAWITRFLFGLFPFILTVVLLKLREDFAITYF